tara:strand:+ start:4495 stop:5061 length:567 start_codon:yes stop_codon:yes gene_type:complete
MKDTIISYLNKASDNYKALESESDNIETVTKLMLQALKNKNKIIFCGNGGSAGDSQHLAAELMGRYKIDRNPLPAIALTVDTSAITSIGNDYGYDKVFSRQLEGIGEKGDVLVGISTSGESKNVLEAIKASKKLSITSVCLTGNRETEMTKLSDYSIKTPSKETNHIQEMHITVGQLMCGIIESELFE